MSRTSRTLRIAQWESKRLLPAPSRKTAGIALLAIILFLAAVAAGITLGSSGSDGMYVVGVDENDPYYEVVEDADEFQTQPPDTNALEAGEQDLVVDSETGLLIADTERADAAATEFRIVVREHNDRTLSTETNDESVSHPIALTVGYVESGDATVPEPTDDISADSADVGGSTATDHDDNGVFSDIRAEFRSTMGFEDSGANTAGELQPPVPFRALILALLFLIPLNFVAQAYGSSVMGERIQNRGELLLTSPASKWEIIAGKTLPYLAAIVAISALVAVPIGAGVLAVLAVIPLGVVLLSGVFVAAMYARSFKELTFITTFLAVATVAYAFVPAMFMDVHPIAAISPLTIVVQSIDPASSINLGALVFSFTPLAVLSISLYAFGASLYREEDMFSHRSIPQKAIDSLSVITTGLTGIPKAIALLMPLVFVIQLLAVAILFPAPEPYNVIVLFVTISVIEELAKSLPVRSGMVSGTFDDSPKAALVCGIVAGLSFFVLEKIAVFGQVVGLQHLQIGQAAFGDTFAIFGGGPLALAVFFAPAVLHVTATTIASYGAAGTRRRYAAAFAAAVIIHTTYNLTVVMLFA